MRKIKEFQLRFLEKELSYLKDQGAGVHLNPDELEKYYEVEQSKNSGTATTVLWVGAVLIGIGILSFIASNWSNISPAGKYMIIIAGVVGFFYSAWKTERIIPNTSRALYYIGGFLFGAGIFLIGQAFHLGGQVYPAFLWWAIGLLPMAYYLKDKAVLLFSVVLLSAYSFEIYFVESYPFMLLAAIPAIYYINHRALNRSAAVFLLNSALLVQFIHSQLWFFDVNQFFVIGSLFIAGLLISKWAVQGYAKATETLGTAIHGGYGVVLTLPWTWNILFGDAFSDIAAIIFAVAYGLYVIYLVKDGKLLPILILSAIILRFYIDLSYDFLPRSLFFVIGGIVLLAFGFWFEWRRRGGTDDAKE
ncbi:MAG: DUF2157 domain-containing protein [Bacillus sp. (in: firmicutes)]